MYIYTSKTFHKCSHLGQIDLVRLTTGADDRLIYKSDKSISSLTDGPFLHKLVVLSGTPSVFILSSSVI